MNNPKKIDLILEESSEKIRPIAKNLVRELKESIGVS
jgi:hypothetical protein